MSQNVPKIAIFWLEMGHPLPSIGVTPFHPSGYKILLRPAGDIDGTFGISLEQKCPIDVPGTAPSFQISAGPACGRSWSLFGFNTRPATFNTVFALDRVIIL
jgi:hypothetical protein